MLAKGFGFGDSTSVSPSSATLAEGVELLADGAADAGPLPASPAVGSLAQGESDLFEIELAEGERIELTLAAPVPAGSVFDLYLYAPGLDQLVDAVAVAHATEGPFPRTLSYVVPAGVAGTYYIEVNAWDGAGDYSLAWLKREASEYTRQDVGAETPLAIPADEQFTLADEWGANTLYAIDLSAGSRVRIDISGPADADFDLYLYAPDTASILPTDTVPVAYGNFSGSNERIIFDVPGGAAGTYYLEVYRFNGGGNGTLTITEGPVPAAPSVDRVWGDVRYDTAAAISAEAFPAGSQTAVLASGRSFPDGLAASSLAGALRVPVLLTGSTTLHSATAEELTRLGVSKVYVVGGTVAIGSGVETAIEALGAITVERVSGDDRYATAAEVALKTREITGTNPQMIFLASGQNFPDALALSPVAFSTKTPILLTRATSLPGSTATVISQLKGTNHYDMDVLVAGGPVAVRDSVATQAATLAGGTLTRVAGSNRYNTALEIAEYAVFAGWADPETLAIASGAAFPDALAGGPLPGMRDGVLLLTRPNSLDSAPRNYLSSFDFAVNECWVLGGSGAVSQTVFSAIEQALPAEPLLK